MLQTAFLPTESQSDVGVQHTYYLVIQGYILTKLQVPDNVQTFWLCQTPRPMAKAPLR